MGFGIEALRDCELRKAESLMGEQGKAQSAQR